MSTQNAVLRGAVQVPTSIESLWGTPELLYGEEAGAYKALWLDVARDIEPSDVIEWLWINDILELTWEIRRLRRFKTQLMQRNFEVGINDYLAEGLTSYQKLDVLEARSEARRNSVLHEIEGRRAMLATRIRNASDRTIEGRVTGFQLSPPPIG